MRDIKTHKLPPELLPHRCFLKKNHSRTFRKIPPKKFPMKHNFFKFTGHKPPILRKLPAIADAFLEIFQKDSQQLFLNTPLDGCSCD